MAVKQIQAKPEQSKDKDPKELVDRFKQLKGARSNFESYWQSLHDYFYIESPNANRAYYPGTELDATFLYDSTTLECADVFASGFMNYLTPPSSKWFKLRAKNPGLTDNKDVSDYLETVAEEVYHTLNKSNFYDQMYPSYKDSGVYGTSVLLEEEDILEVARFYSVPLKQVCIVEDARGRPAEFYIEFEYTPFQAIDRWGVDKVSDAIREDAKKGRSDKKYSFLLVIAKRSIRDIVSDTKENMPISALWVDVAEKKLMETGGYNEFPAMAHRFDKRPFISWGFSPAMKTLPFARILNAMAKTNLRAMTKRTDPLIAFPDNAFIMPFNSNPRAINYYKKGKMDGQKDIFAFNNYGDPQTGMAAIEYYTQQVKSLMYHDVFLAFDNLTKQMNNPEIMERINEKMTLLGPAVGRYIGEVLNPIVIRTIGILFRKGRLPDPPDELIQDGRYEIDYVSQLAQAQKRSELNVLTAGLTLIGQMAQFTPEVLDKIDPDQTVNTTWDILGAPVAVLRDDKEVQQIRENRAQQQAIDQEVAIAGGIAQAGKTAAEGDKAYNESKQVGK